MSFDRHIAVVNSAPHNSHCKLKVVVFPQVVAITKSYGEAECTHSTDEDILLGIQTLEEVSEI